MPETAAQAPTRAEDDLPEPPHDHAPALLLSVDWEDWHQLVRRRYGHSDWAAPGPALARQTETVLALLDELGLRCTFFVLGMAARSHPDLVRALADAGHEIACHGDAHLPVRSQTQAEFTADLRRAIETIEELTGRRPRGYRAPAFSITPREAPWVHEALAREGFAYDASHTTTPSVRAHIPPLPGGPHPLAALGLWELPVAAWRWRSLALPVGGASYWSLAPTPLVVAALHRAPPWSGLYLHPQEFDPDPLDPLLGAAGGPVRRARMRARVLQRELARRRAVPVLRAIAARHRLITYGEAHARLAEERTAGAGPLPVQGAPVR